MSWEYGYWDDGMMDVLHQYDDEGRAWAKGDGRGVWWSRVVIRCMCVPWITEIAMA
jgi:hypothetical protein